MNIFPNIPDLLLTIFASLLSLAVSLFILKIQRAHIQSVGKIEERKIIIAEQPEIKKFLRGRLITSKEFKDARDFLDNEAEKVVPEFYEKMVSFKRQFNKIKIIVGFGVFFSLLSLGTTIYMLIVLFTNNWEIHLYNLILFATIYIISFIYLRFQNYQVKEYIQNFDEFEKQLVYFTGEILRAAEIVYKE